MTDLVQRLRALCNSFAGNYDIRLLAGQAADELDALAARLAEADRLMRKYGLGHADDCAYAHDPGRCRCTCDHYEARTRFLTADSAPPARCSHKFNEWAQCELPAGHDGVHWLRAETAHALLAMGDPIPSGGCGCRHNGVPIMRAQCAIHGEKLTDRQP